MIMKPKNFSIIKDKRGVGVLDMATKVFGALLVLGVMGFVFIIIFGHLSDTADDLMPTALSKTVLNETLTTVEEDEEFFPDNGIDVADLYEATCTIIHVANESSGTTIESTNYTSKDEGCRIEHPQNIGDIYGFNNSNWNVSFSYTSKDSSVVDVTQNLTGAAASFFSNASTWLTLLSVVIIISIVALVIAKVKGNKEGGLGGSTGSNRSNDGLL